MKIYEFKYKGGETDWVFATDMKEAKEFYINHTGCVDLIRCDVKIVPKKDWDSTYILDIDKSEPNPDEVNYNENDYCCGYKIKETFADYAERETITEMICTTEF